MVVRFSILYLTAAVSLQHGSCKVSTITIAPGVEMPMLALGTFRPSLKGCSVADAVDQWLQLGGRHIDTAFNYGTQLDVGSALKRTSVLRSDIFLTTKIPGPIGKENVTDMVSNVSLAELGIDYIDLVLIHTPCKHLYEFPDLCGAKYREERLSTWEGLADLQSAGKIRAIGVSNFNTNQVTELLEVGYKPAVNQVQWHLGYHNETLWSGMEDLGVRIEAWAPLAGPTAAGHPGVALGDERLQAVAQRYNVSTAQVELRWSMQRGVTPVTATCSRGHALDDLASFDFDLAEGDVSYLDSLRPAAEAPLFA